MFLCKSHGDATVETPSQSLGKTTGLRASDQSGLRLLETEQSAETEAPPTPYALARVAVWHGAEKLVERTRATSNSEEFLGVVYLLLGFIVQLDHSMRIVILKICPKLLCCRLSSLSCRLPQARAREQVAIIIQDKWETTLDTFPSHNQLDFIPFLICSLSLLVPFWV